MSLLGGCLLFLAGVISGFVNVTAGGGSMLTLPLLVFLGMDMSVANATNRIGILMQNIVASSKFYKEKTFTLREAFFFVLPACLGSVAGTFLALKLNEAVLRIVVSILISIMAVQLVMKPKMWERQFQRKVPPWVLQIVFFFIGVYGGFIQAGVGFFFIWALAGLAGYDLLHSNAIKVVVILSYTCISLLLFASRGLVQIGAGVAIALGTMIGGFIGAKFSLVKGNKWLRWILAVVVFISAGKMIYDVVFMIR